MEEFEDYPEPELDAIEEMQQEERYYNRKYAKKWQILSDILDIIRQKNPDIKVIQHFTKGYTASVTSCNTLLGYIYECDEDVFFRYVKELD